ncbi:MAG: tRNA guanosine(34) transglycosylase Tgt [Parvibaculum sp.]|uniref:tRNA guanosine(34) transglycosylase Tgt n=1 Tax=Parvibaculum sp. TaxID=2024848 RepID=UPI003C73F752
MSQFRFELKGRDGAARTGLIHTPRGQVRTPAFMPVGTAGTVKALYPDQVHGTGADIILGNTYHLMLRPGAEEIAALGGLHRFANWPHPILTDSGGFQVMSLTKLRKMTEEGVTFSSHLDGSRHLLTPERSIEIQCLLGSDIQMVLDECTPFPATEEQARKSMELSMRWAKRSRAAFEAQPHRKEGQALFGIVQGSTYEHLRAQSSAGLLEIGFDGYAVGGLAVGEGQVEMLRVLDFTVPLLPQDRPRYLMGVGTPDDIVEAVRRGIDMFDCVMPTRNGRHGLAFTRRGRVNLRNARHAADPRPLDPESSCPAARDYSRAYLHHLIKSGEILGSMLVSWINVAYYEELMAGIRAAIAEERFEAFVEQFKADQASGDIAPFDGGK